MLYKCSFSEKNPSKVKKSQPKTHQDLSEFYIWYASDIL